MFIFKSDSCGFCIRAMDFLKRHDVRHLAVNISELKPKFVNELIDFTNSNQIPKIFVNTAYVPERLHEDKEKFRIGAHETFYVGGYMEFVPWFEKHVHDITIAED